MPKYTKKRAKKPDPIFKLYDTIRNHRGLRANQWASALGYIGFDNFSSRSDAVNAANFKLLMDRAPKDVIESLAKETNAPAAYTIGKRLMTYDHTNAIVVLRKLMNPTNDPAIEISVAPIRERILNRNAKLKMRKNDAISLTINSAVEEIGKLIAASPQYEKIPSSDMKELADKVKRMEEESAQIRAELQKYM